MDYPPAMVWYLYRECPKCGDYLGVVILESQDPPEEVEVDAR